MVLQFGFGVAAAAVSTGNAPDVEGPLTGVLGRKYREFDWRSLDLFFPEACYAGTNTVTGQLRNTTYSFPLCGFDGECLYEDSTATPIIRELQNDCCDNRRKCDTSNAQCIAGSSCVRSFLSKVGAP